jgi:hypothetical protein
MAKQTINIGSSANDGTGDPLRTAFDKINDNFDELYSTSLSERVSLDTSPQLGGDLDVVTHSIVSTTNRDIVLAPHGTGAVKASSLKFSGTSISSDDSTQVQINEGLNVSGATSLSTSLALATGATVTGIDNGALGSSATLLATQGAIKTYVDAQVTAQDLDFAGDSGGAQNVDLDSQSLTIAGGTGIASVGSAQTITLNIDATVATLSGSQTLTNKVLTAPTINGATMTGPVTLDTITFDNNIIKANASNADLELDGNGTGAVKILANASVVGTLTTADITNTNNITTTQLDADGVRIKDNLITTNSSNANLEITANGSGVVDVKTAMTTIGQTITGNVGITGRIDIDNIAISGNGIIATNSGGGININPNATGQVTIGGSIVSVPAMLAATDINVTSQLFLGSNAKILTNSSNADIILEPHGTGSVVMDQVSITDNQITTHVSNADLKIGTDGTGKIDITVDTIKRTGDLVLDVSGYIVLDSDGGETFLRDGSAGNYGSLLRNGANDLTIASGSTQALIFSGANAAFQGNLSASGAQVSFANLPTSDPGVAGRLWRDGTTVKISV